MLTECEANSPQSGACRWRKCISKHALAEYYLEHQKILLVMDVPNTHGLIWSDCNIKDIMHRSHAVMKGSWKYTTFSSTEVC